LGENVRPQRLRVSALTWGPYQFDWSEYERELRSLLGETKSSLDSERTR
jgi:hypothetical protein